MTFPFIRTYKTWLIFFLREKKAHMKMYVLKTSCPVLAEHKLGFLCPHAWIYIAIFSQWGQWAGSCCHCNQ